MSTLSRGDEIENDFYNLKSQEWGCSRQEAKLRIMKTTYPDTMRVYVVMGNDFPECVFTTEQAAGAFMGSNSWRNLQLDRTNPT